MPNLIIKVVLTALTTSGLVFSGTTYAATDKRINSSLEREVTPRVSTQNRQTPTRTYRRQSVSPPTSTINRRSTATIRKPTTTSKPATSSYQKPQRSYKPATSTYQKPQRTYKPATSTYQKPQTSYKPITSTKPTVNKYRAPVTNYQPPINNYRPPINAYKPPTNSSGSTSNRPGSMTSRPVFPKPSVSRGYNRSEDHDDSRASHSNNRNHARPYRPWSTIFNHRYNPSSHNNWYNNAGHRFPIEQSYGIWANSYNQAYRPGYSTSYLPSYYNRFSWNNRPYYSYGGLYFSYSRGNSHFSLVSAPIGYRMSNLPRHSIGFYLGNDLFFNAYNNYYRWLPTSREYIVVDRPVYDEELVEYIDEAYAEPEHSYHVSYNDGSPIYYPSAGQNEAQMSLDLDECHVWSAKETNFDPSIPYPSHDEYKAESFGLALEACMTSRGYTIL